MLTIEESRAIATSWRYRYYTDDVTAEAFEVLSAALDTVCPYAEVIQDQQKIREAFERDAI